MRARGESVVVKKKGFIQGAPTMVEGVKELVSMKDDEKPDGPGNATAPKTQLRPEPGTPGASRFGNLATLPTSIEMNQIEKQKNNSLDQHKCGVETKKRIGMWTKTNR
jgi:hypothetical protein